MTTSPPEREPTIMITLLMIQTSTLGDRNREVRSWISHYHKVLALRSWISRVSLVRRPLFERSIWMQGETPTLKVPCRPLADSILRDLADQLH